MRYTWCFYICKETLFKRRSLRDSLWGHALKIQIKLYINCKWQQTKSIIDLQSVLRKFQILIPKFTFQTVLPVFSFQHFHLSLFQNLTSKFDSPKFNCQSVIPSCNSRMQFTTPEQAARHRACPWRSIRDCLSESGSLIKLSVFSTLPIY